MNILLTGATGFVGQHFLEYLLSNKKGYKIIAFSRRDENPEFDFVQWIPVSSDYLKILKDYKIDVIIHLAGKAHDTKNTSEAAEYFKVNTEFTKSLFDAFYLSEAKKFIFLSTIKAVGDNKTYVNNSQDLSELITPYAKSKRDAEIYIENKLLKEGKSFYILRPTLIYGKRVKGNLKTLVKFAKKGIPYPFEAFENKRSYLSVNNLNMIFCKISEEDYPSFTLNIANEDAISTKELMHLISNKLHKKPLQISIPESVIKFAALIGDYLPFPLNNEKLQKITSSFVVDTAEMTKTLGFHLPETTRETISVITD